ncbi:MAG: M24 family metallopeptidase [Thermomicrobiales bacterium]
MATSARLSRVRALCDQIGADALLISDPNNRFYVTGYSGEDHGLTESAGIALISADDAILYTSPNNTEWAASETTGFSVAGWSRPWETFVAEEIDRLGLQTIGFEPGSLSYQSWRAISEHGKGFALEPMSGELDRIRWVKDAAEVALIQRAIDITDQVFESVEDELAEGMTERQVAQMIEDRFRARGADGPAFSTAVAVGPHGARPHHNTGDSPLIGGVPIVIDMGARMSGYCADLTRTVWLGELDDEAARVYSLVLASQQAALAEIRAGVPASTVDLASRNVFEDAGYGEAIVHSVGHGLGIPVHDGPSVAKFSDLPLEAGNVVTIEPGLYFPGAFGVRIEDVVLVEEGGYRMLSHARKAVISSESGVED